MTTLLLAGSILGILILVLLVDCWPYGRRWTERPRRKLDEPKGDD